MAEFASDKRTEMYQRKQAEIHAKGWQLKATGTMNLYAAINLFAQAEGVKTRPLPVPLSATQLVTEKQ